jgi:Fe-S oxidoreductase
MLSRPGLKKPFNQPEIYNILDLCLSCKACKSECPSNVDMAKLKAEFMQQWYRYHPVPLRTLLIANITIVNSVGMVLPWLFNHMVTSRILSRIFKKVFGFALNRTIPVLGRKTVRRWSGSNLKALNAALPDDAPEVILYVDEFTNYNDTHLGITTIRLLNKLGIKVLIVKHPVSARTYISKGLLRKARHIARKNVIRLKDSVTEERPLVGIEPSAILGFRDEFPELVGADLADNAKQLSDNCFTVEEYLVNAYERGWFGRDLFTTEELNLKLHGHCQQKAIASTEHTIQLLSIPENYRVEEIPSGCCGMAGSFGYEKEHYDLSMRVGELVLFPAVRESDQDTLIVAPGTSCRHQIHDGTGRKALHPVEVMYKALL